MAFQLPTASHVECGAGQEDGLPPHPIGTRLHRQVYYEEFKALVAVVEIYGRTVVDPGLVESKLTLT